ncbi:Profilin-4 [Gaertneriomyces sp. JEL0708]|nr:profilin-4-like protein [Gaertneriomyces semiglobifer]KAJ3190014.1 Profilin-4 [Gaertneriomyces sp. JEL0708]
MNSFIDEALLATKHVDQAAIIRIKDGAVKAKSQKFWMSSQEWGQIQNAFANPREVRTLDPGLTVLDQDFRVIRADQVAVYAKNDDRCGVVIAKTSQYYILGTYNAKMFASICAEAVEKLAEYLRKKNK